MNTIRIGIVGAGKNTIDRHIPLLRAIEGVEIVSVCNRSKESSEKVRNDPKLNLPNLKIYENWKDLVHANDTDAIVIGTWPHMHHPIVLESIAANKHVLTEARISLNAQQAREMEREAKKKPHLVCQVVPSPFTLKVDNTIRRLIDTRSIGEVLAITICDGGNSFIDSKALLTWRQNVEFSGNNIMGLGIWYEALIRWVEPATGVLASGRIFTKSRLTSSGEEKEVQVPEHLDVIADMKCGAQADIHISSLTGLADPPHAIIYGSEGTLKMEMVEVQKGDKKVKEAKLFGGTKVDTGLKEIEIPKEEEGRWRVEEEFVNAIRGKESISHTTFSDAVKYMAFTDAVVESIRSRSYVIVQQ